MARRQQPVAMIWMALLWTAGLLLWFGMRLWMTHAYQAPMPGLGGWMFLAWMLALAPLVLRPPLLRQGSELSVGLAAAGLFFLPAGLQFMWTHANAQATWLPYGLVLLLGGSVLLTAAMFREGAAAREEENAAELPLGRELALFVLVMAVAAGFRFYRLGEIPDAWWFDEVNLTMRTVLDVLESGRAPLYVGQMIENPGLYLHVGSAAMKALGPEIHTYRILAAFFGVLGVAMFYFLARLWFGSRWAWVAALIYATMRWVLIPQRIAFMSGFALFWVIGATAFLWLALRRGKAWQWAAAGLFTATTWHCYTPSRALIPLLALFVLLSWKQVVPRIGWRGALWFAAGALIPAAAVVYAMATQWDLFWKRAGEVSIVSDIKSQGIVALWISLKRHLLMFHYLGDHNGRHNLPFWPSVDFATGLALAPAWIWMHVRAWTDARARLLMIWFWTMLAMGVLSVLVEAPQAHRTVLLVPALALMAVYLLRDFSWTLSRWMPDSRRSLLPAALVLLAMVPVFNAREYFVVWKKDPHVWRSFSPVSSAGVKRMMAQPAGWYMLQSKLANEYQFHGFEWQFFTRWFVNRHGRQTGILTESNAIPARMAAPLGVLCLWGSTDGSIRDAAKAQFPDLEPEIYLSPRTGEVVYEAMEIPWERVPVLDRQSSGPRPFLYRLSR